MFSMRIVNVDHYLRQPKSGFDVTYSEFRGNEVKLVPVLRIFGSTKSGSKACLHVHGVFPYVLVPCSGEEDVGGVYQLAASLDRAINVSMGISSSNKQHVFKIAKVSGRPFYGYHGQDHQYLKIFFYNPLVIKRASDLLQNGAVCGTQFQIHEGHVPFTLQFFIDYNLYGMSFINLKNVVYRKDQNSADFSAEMLPKESVCEVEVDAVAVDILNRLTVKGELAVNPGLAAIWEEEKLHLNQDVLEDSQRPTPQPTISDILLKERLNKNLGLKGENKAVLKEKMPYPAETLQQQSGHILNASVLDTHSIYSLGANNALRDLPEDVDEDIILNVTKSLSSNISLDTSLLVALNNLDAGRDDQRVEISQNVEEDSILGTQMIPDDDKTELEDALENYQDFLDFSLPVFTGSDNAESRDSDLESNENFEDKIPQLDGIGDLEETSETKSTIKTKSKKLMIEDVFENNNLSSNEGVLDRNKDNDSWLESSKEDGLSDIFSDEEAFNSPLNDGINDEICQNQPLNEDELSEDESFNLNITETSINDVLRGDPTMTREDALSFDDSFLQAKHYESDWCSPPTFNSEDSNSDKVQDLPPKRVYDCKFEFINNNNKEFDLSLSREHLESTGIEKPISELVCEEENLLYSGTAQLDEILNEDLNKGLDMEYDSSECSNDEIITQATTTDLERSEPDDHSVESLDKIENSHSEEKFVETTCQNHSNQGVSSKVSHSKSNKHGRKNDASSSETSYLNKHVRNKNKIKLPTNVKHVRNQNKMILSPNLFQRSRSVEKHPNSYEMTKNEIDRYFLNIESLCSPIDQRCNKLSSWTPLRSSNLRSHEKRCKRKSSRIISILKLATKRNKLTDEEMLKLTSCFVKLKRLAPKKLSNMSNACSDDNNKTLREDVTTIQQKLSPTLIQLVDPTNQVPNDVDDPDFIRVNDTVEQKSCMCATEGKVSSVFTTHAEVHETLKNDSKKQRILPSISPNVVHTLHHVCNDANYPVDNSLNDTAIKEASLLYTKKQVNTTETSTNNDNQILAKHDSKIHHKGSSISLQLVNNSYQDSNNANELSLNCVQDIAGTQQEQPLNIRVIPERTSNVNKAPNCSQAKKHSSAYFTSLSDFNAIGVGTVNQESLYIGKGNVFQDENLYKIQTYDQSSENASCSKEKLCPSSRVVRPLCNKNAKPLNINSSVKPDKKAITSKLSTLKAIKKKEVPLMRAITPTRRKAKNNKDVNCTTLHSSKSQNIGKMKNSSTKCPFNSTSPTSPAKLNSCCVISNGNEKVKSLRSSGSSLIDLREEVETKDIKVTQKTSIKRPENDGMKSKPAVFKTVLADIHEMPPTKDCVKVPVVYKTDSYNKQLHFVPVLVRLSLDQLIVNQQTTVDNVGSSNKKRKRQNNDKLSTNNTYSHYIKPTCEIKTEPLAVRNRSQTPLRCRNNHVSETITSAGIDNTLDSSQLSLRRPAVKLHRSCSLDSKSTCSFTTYKRVRNAEKRRSARLYSLDGTVDNSSDESNDGETLQENKISILPDFNTPSKKTHCHSKKVKSPKSNYNPLDIEIKKSPKNKTRQDEKIEIQVSSSNRDSTTSNVPDHDKLTFYHSVFNESTLVGERAGLLEPVLKETAYRPHKSTKPVKKKIKLDLLITQEKPSLLESTSAIEATTSSHMFSLADHQLASVNPIIRVERLSSLCSSLSSTSVIENSKSEETSVNDVNSCKPKSSNVDPIIRIKKLSLPISEQINPVNDGADNVVPSMATTSINMSPITHQAIKELKISIRRLSCDFPESSTGRNSRLKKKGIRRSSLPVIIKEEMNTIDQIASTENKDLSTKSSHKSDENELKLTDNNDTKVRKMLIFSNDIDNDMDVKISGALSKFKRVMPVRKFSTDLFENNNSSDSSKLKECGQQDSNSFPSNSPKLSGTIDSNDATQIGELTNSSGWLDNSQNYSIVNESVMNINRNPLCLSNPNWFTPALEPPTPVEVMSRLSEHGLPEEVNIEPYYSESTDVARSYEVGNTTLKVKSKSLFHLEEFNGTFRGITELKKICLKPVRNEFSKSVLLTPLKLPPSVAKAKEWLKTKLLSKNKIEGKNIQLNYNAKTLSTNQENLEAVNKNAASQDRTLSSSQCASYSKSTFDDVNSCESWLPSPTGSSDEVTSKISPLMASTPTMGSGPQNKKNKFQRVSSKFKKSLPLIKEEDVCNTIHQNKIDSQAKTTSTPVEQVLDNTVLKQLLLESKSPASVSCQIDMATPNNSGGYRMELENLQDVKLMHEFQYLTIMAIELHMHTRGELMPNPDFDAICCIFYTITNDCPDASISHLTGVIYVNDGDKEEKIPQFKCKINTVPDEQSLIAAFVSLFKKWDPDIIVGYEIEMLSWGYLLQRAYVLNVNLVTQLSRMRITEKPNRDTGRDEDDSEIRLVGRIVLNLWRFLRHEVALQSYTFENIAYHVLHQRVPLFSFRTLTTWWSHRTKIYRWQVLEHYLTRVEGTVQMMQQVDLVGRTSEFARLFGIQFYEVLSRGSQFRVESMMLRLVKPLNYVAVSPSVQQRAKMRAAQSLPLIMEPESRFYIDPVIVLDFQSLYPSIIIAHNYCFSTCLGRVDLLGRSELFEFGCTQLRVPRKEIIRHKNSLNFAPCGVAYVDQSVVKGVLPRMLEEILNTRLMVKRSMKVNKENKTLQRVLHNRQLGLKLIANVTYGYTAANFSGRMPCIEVGDSVVSKARETLERAINLVNGNSKWRVRVVYGDTDSLFVLVPGRSRQEAFRIGAEIAEAVTNDNPKPVKLKLEKVYQPCLLQTKKRYVGYMYENASQEKPEYDAKGIETVRRDGCPAVAKILEKTLRILFETKDVSLVKRFACRQFSKIQSGRISVQELTFAREYRGMGRYRPGACVPALELAKQCRSVDPRSEPRPGQRVPYVIVAGPPGLPLIRLVRSPQALLSDPSLKINAEYYITRVIIPPLARCFSLIGVQVAHWYAELPRQQQVSLPSGTGDCGRKATISQYFVSRSCVGCGGVTTDGVCSQCLARPQSLALTLQTRLRAWQRKLALTNKVCDSCTGRPNETACCSLDCPVLYRRTQAERDLSQSHYLHAIQDQCLPNIPY